MEPAPSSAQQQPPVNQNPLANYQFNSDELRVLRECNSESFFQRSLPFGTSLGLAAYFGVKNGFLKPNITYGAAPKVVVGVIVGYFLGKFSYQRKCIEKMMQLPNSQLGELLRKRHKGGVMQNITGDSMGMGLALSPFNTPSNVDVYSDEHMRENTPSSALNLDTEHNPSFSGLDDIYRPSLDNPGYHPAEPEKPVEPAMKPATTYEERRKNREELMRKYQHRLSRPLPSEAPTVIRRQEPSTAGDDPNAGSGEVRKNKYGDTWTG